MEPPVSRTGSLVRVSHGCWTCRLRKKRCDDRHPVCGTCAALLITCYYDREKPAWMDGGLLQEEMGRQLKLEVKEKAHLRRADQRSTHDYIPEHPTLETTAPSQTACYPSNNTITHREFQNVDPTHLVLPQHGLDFYNFQFSDSVQFTFYFEHVFPFLFPFYRPCPLDGGKAWVLEMMLRSPLIRHAILCLSSHFSSLANLTCHEASLDKVLSQTQDAFQMLRKALQFIDQNGTADHLRCSVRVLAGVLQIQRFEVAVLNFDNCQAHLNAAIILFKQIMDSSGAADAKSKFRIVTDQLGGPLMSEDNTWKSNAEQATFSFSSAILMLDDIVASTMLRQAPNLYEYRHLLEGHVNMENTVGCQNWALLGIADIAALDAWKQEQIALGQLDILEFAQRAQSVKDMLETGLEAMSIAWHERGFLEALTETSRLTRQMTTHVWAHAGLLYLSVVASGWQLTSKYIQGHVGRIIEILTALSPVVLRTVVWPFCVAGCLAMPEQEIHFRAIAQGLHPSSVFGTVHKALEVMEAVWQSRDSQRDLATCFQGRGHLVLLS